MAEGIDLSGRTLGGYELKERIGQGGMADVYLASKRFVSEYRRELERQFAVKILFGTTADAARRFETEMAILLRLNHTNIIRVYDYAVVDGRAYGLAEPFRYFVMDYLDGGTLYERVKRGQLDVREAIGVLRVVASALDFAHSEGILHRDIKPGNVLFDRAGNPVLADFGISKLAMTPAADCLPTPHPMDATSDGIMLGTPPYVAPEAFRGEPLDRRADLYSFGVLAYFALGGQLPFEGDTTEALLAKILFSEPRSLSAVNPTIPQRTANAVSQMLSKVPDERYPTASDFVRAVERGLDDSVEVDRDTLRLPIPTPESGLVVAPDRAARRALPRRRIAAITVMLLVAVAIALAVVYAFTLARRSDPVGEPVSQSTPSPAPPTDAPVPMLAGARMVTNADYRACLEDGACTAQPAYPATFNDPALASRPVVGLDWFAAREYCLWRGGRLPLLDEWPVLVAAAQDGPESERSVREWLMVEDRQTLAPATNMPVRGIVSPEREMVKPANEVGADVSFRCVGG